MKKKHFFAVYAPNGAFAFTVEADIIYVRLADGVIEFRQSPPQPESDVPSKTLAKAELMVCVIPLTWAYLDIEAKK